MRMRKGILCKQKPAQLLEITCLHVLVAEYVVSTMEKIQRNIECDENSSALDDTFCRSVDTSLSAGMAMRPKPRLRVRLDSATSVHRLLPVRHRNFGFIDTSMGTTRTTNKALSYLALGLMHPAVSIVSSPAARHATRQSCHREGCHAYHPAPFKACIFAAHLCFTHIHFTTRLPS